MRLFKTLCAVAFLLIPTAAQAGKASTSYSYYTVDGSSAGQILLSLTRKGPRLGGVNAFATTRASFVQSGRMLSTGSSCKVDRIAFSGRYVVKLPRHRSEGRIAGPTKSAWNQFESFVRIHEDKHVAIWNACIADLERQARSISARNCNAVEAKLAKLAERIRAQCGKQHERLDARDQNALPGLPLIRQALNQGSVSIRPPRRKKR